MAMVPDSYGPVWSHHQIEFEIVWDFGAKSIDNEEIVKKLVMEFKHILPELAKIRIMEAEIAKAKRELKEFFGYEAR